MLVTFILLEQPPGCDGNNNIAINHTTILWETKFTVRQEENQLVHPQTQLCIADFPQIFKDFFPYSTTPLSLLNWINLHVCSPNVHSFQNGLFHNAPLNTHAKSYKGVNEQGLSWEHV